MAWEKGALWGLAMLALAGCRSSNSDEGGRPIVRSAIPELRNLPYCLYVVELKSGAVDRLSIDGSRETTLVGRSPRSSEEERQVLRFNKSEEDLFGLVAPGADVSIRGAFGGQGGLTLQKRHASQADPRSAPVWERLKVDPPSKVDLKLSGAAPLLDSRWTATYSERSALIHGRSTSVMVEVTLRNEDGRSRTYRFRADPAAPVRVLGIFASRFVLVFDNPDLQLWDLETDSRRLLAQCQDVTLARWDPKLNDMRPQARVLQGSNLYEWSLRNPDDLTPEPQFQVRAPAQ